MTNTRLGPLSSTSYHTERAGSDKSHTLTMFRPNVLPLQVVLLANPLRASQNAAQPVRNGMIRLYLSGLRGLNRRCSPGSSFDTNLTVLKSSISSNWTPIM